jgi:phosphoglycolate phosphatase
LSGVRKYRLVMFDSDGTLADTLPWMRSVFNELADEFGFRRVEPHEYGQFRDLHGAAMLKALGLPLWKLPRVVVAMRRRMAAHAGEFRPFAGVAEMLSRLSARGIELAVVSSNSLENVRRVLGPENERLFGRLDCGVSMSGKASRLSAAVRAAGVAPDDAIYIGDEIRDGEAARKARVHFGAATWGQHSAEALRTCAPEFVFASPAEIAEVLG